MDYVSKYHSPIGHITLASDGEALVGLWFDEGRYYGDVLEETYEEKELPVFQRTKQWLDIYFAGARPEFTPRLLIRGSDFRKKVCEIMLTIPYGQTMTYKEIAERITEAGKEGKMSAQAVGGAVGHNPISIIVPCHRVVGTGGSLTGYGGGIDRKVKLLELENTDMKGLFVPSKGTAL
jgi:methylated-DNA-[protein]-cysteine S-methyltransferase